MKIEFLADRPTAVPLVSKWYFDQWGHKIKDNSIEKICERVNGMLNRDKIPLHILGVEGDEVLGVAQLKIREMEIYPEKEYWLGGVYVAPKARNKKIATKLISRALELAKSFHVRTLYLQTECMDGGLYARLGWKPIEKAHYSGLYVLVMERSV